MLFTHIDKTYITISKVYENNPIKMFQSFSLGNTELFRIACIKIDEDSVILVVKYCKVDGEFIFRNR